MKNIATDAAVMATQLASGQASARELLQSCLARVDATDAQVNAFTEKTVSRAFAEADAVDAMRKAGHMLGPLAGVPYAVKNLFDIEGVVTLAGSRVWMPPGRTRQQATTKPVSSSHASSALSSALS